MSGPDIAAFIAARLSEEEQEGFPRPKHEIEALRAIVKLHTGPHECSSYNDMIGDFDNCMWIDEFDVCSTMRHAAAIWAGHPGYDPGWAPQQQSGPGA